MRWLFDGATCTFTLPHGPLGRPRSFSPPGPSFSHVSPPSRETCSPLPDPPLTSSQGRRRACHIPASTTRGLLGSMQTSDAPVFSLSCRTFCHVLPPSRVRRTPRFSLGPNGLPSTAA